MQELNRSLSDKLAALSDEYKTEREAHRSKLGEAGVEHDRLQHEKAALESKVEELEEHIEVLQRLEPERNGVLHKTLFLQMDN